MKKLMMTVLVLGSLTAQAHESYVIKLDWAKPGTLQDSVVQQCDDTYYDQIEIVVPGQPYEDFSVEMDADITSGEVSVGCSVQKVDQKNSTKYIIDAESGCTIKVHKNRKNFKEKPQTAVYDISDAC